MVLVCALLSGDNRSLDALTATLASLSLPSVLSTIEDFMWCKLAMVNVSGGAGAQVRLGMEGRRSQVGSSQGMAPLAMLHCSVAPYFCGTQRGCVDTPPSQLTCSCIRNGAGTQLAC